MAAKIHLKEAYRGWASNEQVIPAGVYEQKDPVLCGQADYFVNVARIAEWIEPGQPEPDIPAAPEPEVVDETPDLRHADEIVAAEVEADTPPAPKSRGKK